MFTETQHSRLSSEVHLPVCLSASCPGWRWTTRCPAPRCPALRGYRCIPGWPSPLGPSGWSAARRTSPSSPPSHLNGQTHSILICPYTAPILNYFKIIFLSLKMQKYFLMAFELWACAVLKTTDLKLMGLFSQTEGLRLRSWCKT